MPTHFRPSQHGFPFANCFPARTPVLELRTPLGRIPIGDAGGGVCGGMVFTSLDLFLAAVKIPATSTPEVFRYLCRRLLDSFDLPFGLLRYYDWQRRPAFSRFLSGVRIQSGVHALTVAQWPSIRDLLDRGRPAPLGIVKAHSLSPRDLGQNHQVLAYDYIEANDMVTVLIYDPNYPGDDAVSLKLPLAHPDAAAAVEHSREGASVRGFFLTQYSQPVELLSFDAS